MRPYAPQRACACMRPYARVCGPSPSTEQAKGLGDTYKLSPLLETQNSPMSLCGATFLHSMRLTDAAKMMRHRVSWSVPLLAI